MHTIETFGIGTICVALTIAVIMKIAMCAITPGTGLIARHTEE
jgi:hypothetical protein